MRERQDAERGAQRQVVVVAALLALLLAVLALLVATAGTSRFGDARTAGVVDGPLLPTAEPEEAAAQEEPEEPEQQSEVRPPRWLPVLLVLVVSVLMALAARALRRVVRAVAQEEAEPPPVGDADGDPQGLVLDELRSVARELRQDLGRGGTGVADAVVLCWERLEQLGERLGTPRPLHETPTEFGADLLRRNGADPAAVDELLHLYHRARFGRGSVPDSDADRAARALDRVADTLRTADAPVGGGRGERGA